MFDDVLLLVRGGLPAALGAPHAQPGRWGVKVWFGDEAKEHYEAQVLAARHVEGARRLAVEIGFHAEHKRPEDNVAVLDRLVAEERRWRPVLGDDAVAGDFLGRTTSWRRLSETWADPDLSDPDVVVEIAARLGDYVTALEPVRRGEPARPPRRSRPASRR